MSHVKQHKTIIEITSFSKEEAITMLRELHQHNVYATNEIHIGQGSLKIHTIVDENESDIETEIEEFENDNIKVTYTETQIIHTIKSKL